MGVVIEKDINIELKINTVALKGIGAYKSNFISFVFFGNAQDLQQYSQLQSP